MILNQKYIEGIAEIFVWLEYNIEIELFPTCTELKIYTNEFLKMKKVLIISCSIVIKYFILLCDEMNNCFKHDAK